MPLVRLSMLLLVFFRPSGLVSVLLDAAYDPRLNTLSSSTSGVYLRTNDTSTSADSTEKKLICKYCRFEVWTVKNQQKTIKITCIYWPLLFKLKQKTFCLYGN